MMDDNKREGRDEEENPLQSPTSSDDEKTKEVKLNIHTDPGSSTRGDHDESPEEGELPGDAEIESEWVSEAEIFPESEDQHSIDMNGDLQVSSRHPTGDPEETGGWWGDIPFTPIEALEADEENEDTQPVHTDAPDQQETRLNPVNEKHGFRSRNTSHACG